MSWLEASVRWYAVLAICTWAFAPFVRWLCVALADRGVSIARPLAVLAAIYPAWLLSSIEVIPFGATPVVAVVAVAGIIGWSYTFHADVDRAWVRQLCVAEAASVLLFAAALWLRGFTPEILGTEKPMDIAFLASSSRAIAMPPLDPWFAGEPINYYYLGYLLHGTVGRLAGVPPEIGFNLALATIFSTTAVAAFGVVWNVARPRLGAWLAAAGGFFAAFALVLSGNLLAPLRLIQNAPAVVTAWWWDTAIGIGWRSSRIVCDGARVDGNCLAPATETINEFPFFSLLLGDLHPHLMALPYTLLAIGLAWNLSQTRRDETGFNKWHGWLRLALSGAVVGALYALNSWDFPTYLLVLLVGAWAGAEATITRAWKPLLVVIGFAVLAWLPFLLKFVPPTTSISPNAPSWVGSIPVLSSVLSAVALHHGERTSLAEYLTIFGVPYAFGLALLASGIVNSPTAMRQQVTRMLPLAAAATIVPGILLAAPVIPLCGIPASLAFVQLRHGVSGGPRAVALLLYGLAWSLSVGVELVYIRDAFDDRMNTLFKIYYQAWTAFAIATALTVVILWSMAGTVIWKRAMIGGATTAAIVAGLAYPVVASYQWTEGFATWQGLNGLAYAEPTSPGDVAAIRWLAANAKPGDVVLEAAGCSYRPSGRLPFNRVSAFTGVPAPVGWANHERQWRAGRVEHLAEIDSRQADVRDMYADPESPLFDEYGVDWVVIGEYESDNWKSECDVAGPYPRVRAFAEHPEAWEMAFTSGATAVYRRQP